MAKWVFAGFVTLLLAALAATAEWWLSPLLDDTNPSKDSILVVATVVLAIAAVIALFVQPLTALFAHWLSQRPKGERVDIFGPDGEVISTTHGGVGAGRDIPGVATDGDVRDSNIVTGDRPIVADKVIYEASGIAPTTTALHQLPTPPADFTGRRAELDELLDKIGEGGVTISGIQGMGGIGKTALALKLAELLTGQYTAAQVYLNLRGAHEQEPLSPSDAMAHVVRSFDRQAAVPESEDELRGLYLSVLSGKRALLLMDNARDTEQVEPLIPPPGCLLLVTSRRRFTLPGLHPIELKTLPPEDARKLLLKIAPRIGDHADAIAELCGYLPEALRPAASALAEHKDLSPVDYVKRLEDSRTRLEFVEASLGLSYDLLGERLQARWRTLAVFPDTFDVAAAAAVWEVEPDEARDTLGELLRYSLVEWDEASGRYRLHDLARLYAGSRLSEDERAAAQRRHAAHYRAVLALAGDLYEKGGEYLMRGLALFDLESPNIQAGQYWATAHADKDDEAARLCNSYPNAGAYVLALRQHPRRRIDWLEAALAAAQRLNDREAEGRHLGNLGIAYANLGEPRHAIEYHEKALAISREIGDKQSEGQNLGNLGIGILTWESPGALSSIKSRRWLSLARPATAGPKARN